MRRKGRKKNIFPKVMFIVLTFLSFVSISYSYLSASLKITGKVTGKYNEQNFTYASGSNPNLAINIAKINSWQEGSIYKYQYSIRLSNKGQSVISGFKITLEYLNKVDAIVISNYNSSVSNRTVVISSTNYRIDPQGYIVIDFIINSSVASQMVRTVKLEITEESKIVSSEQFNVTFVITNSFGNYNYQYTATLTNKTGVKINAWQLDIALPTQTSFVSGTNAIYSYNNNTLTIKNNSSNGRINNLSSTNISFQLLTNILNYIPSDIRVLVR